MNTRQTAAQKRLKRSALNFAQSSNRLLQKILPAIFLTMSYSVFMVILCRILESHFERNQSKVDYSKNCGKKKNASTVLFGSW